MTDNKAMKGTNRVYTATPFKYCQLGYFGKATNMLLRQFQFPDTYSDLDKLVSANHDQCMRQDYEQAQRCFKTHTGTWDLYFDGWLYRASDEMVMAFIKDLLKTDPGISWTGYRILGTINRNDGYPFWTLELFAKHPDSNTKLYTGTEAPNVHPRKKRLNQKKP